jgi:phage N-6-adenine-methyltransferase
VSAALITVPEDTKKELLVIERLAAALEKAASVDEIKDVRDRAMAIQLYTRKKAGGLAAAQSAGRVVTDATIALAKLYEEEPSIEGHRTDLEDLKGPGSSGSDTGYRGRGTPATPGKHALAEAIGIHSSTLNKFKPLVHATTDRIETAKAAIEFRGDVVTPKGLLREVTAASASEDYDGDEWYTPPDILDAVRRVLGKIDLDPASNTKAQRNVQAKAYFTKQDDALTKEWYGRVFCNPPYSAAAIKAFTEHLLEEVDADRVIEAIYLVNNCTDAGWFHSLAQRFPFCLTRGRISFYNAKDEVFPTRQGQAIFYIGEQLNRFCEVFSKLGIVVGRMR